MPDIDEIINGAIDAAEAGNELPEAEETPVEEEPAVEEPAAEEEPAAAEEPAPATEEPVAEVPAKEGEKPVATKKDVKPESDEDKALTKLLEEHGIKAPVAGQRENKIPYPRVRKIVGNALKRAKETATTETKKLTEKYQPLEAEVTNYRRVDELIEKDFPKYMGLLQSLHPEKWKAYAESLNLALASKAEAVPDEKDDPKPQADVKYEDGSVGYSPEQHDKLLAWAGRKGAREALKTADARFKPLEERLTNEQKAQAAVEQRNQRMGAIKEEIKTLRAHFGELFTADEKLADDGKSEIIAYQKANRVGLTQATLAVLLPKLAANRAKIRQEVMAELAQRKAAAKAAPVGTKRPARNPNEEVATSDVINDALAAAGL